MESLCSSHPVSPACQPQQASPTEHEALEAPNVSERTPASLDLMKEELTKAEGPSSPSMSRQDRDGTRSKHNDGSRQSCDGSASSALIGFQDHEVCHYACYKSRHISGSK